jgi:hypothetical protein
MRINANRELIPVRTIDTNSHFFTALASLLYYTRQSTKHLTKTIDIVPVANGGGALRRCAVWITKPTTYLIAGPRPLPFIWHGEYTTFKNQRENLSPSLVIVCIL